MEITWNPLILGFRVDALHDSVRIGCVSGGFSEESGVGYSAKTGVDEFYRPCGLGSELLHQKLKVFQELGGSVFPSVEASDAGRELVKSHSFGHNEALAHLANDETCTKELYDYFNWWAESEEFKY